MEPLIVDPNSYSKQAAYELAKAHAEAFLDLNGIERPRSFELASLGKLHGMYKNGSVFVDLKRSRVPTKTPGFQWSYTGYKSDLTAPGILAHEIGHHVHFRLGVEPIIRAMRGITKIEANVTSYEPNASEAFAEAAKLLVLNPDLLRRGRPKRWGYMTNALGLKPLHDARWQDVLKNAHPRFFAAAEAWIAKGRNW
jgi:hypothetical protein